MKSAKSIMLERERNLTKPLSTEEQFEYAKKAIAGNGPENQQARERLVLSMTGLIIDIASKLYKIQSPHQIEDVVQESYSILLQIFSPPDETKSIQARFNPDFEVKPSTYASWWIHFAIGKYFSENRIIALPRGLGYLTSQFRERYSNLESISTKEVVEFIKKKGVRVSSRTLEHALVSEQVASLDDHIDDRKTTFLEVLGNEVEPDKDIKDRKIAIVDEAMEQSLSEREIRVMRLKYEQGYNQREIGEMLGVSGSRVGQILRNAERKLRRWILRNYPDIKN